MCSDPPRFGGLRSALALGLILAATGAARAQPRPAWVDPPAKAAAGTPAPKAEPQPQAQRPSSPDAARPGTDTASGADRDPKPDAMPDAKPARTAGETAPDAEREAMAGPGRSAAREHRRRRTARRPAPPRATLAVAPERAGAAALDPRFDDWAGRARDLADAYLAAFSGPNGAMVSGASRFYGERLRFHGRMTTFAALLDEKRRFAQRWPERRYEPHDTRTACNAAQQSCIVRTLVDFRAGNPARGARSQGVAELVLEVSFAGGRPVIVSESSRVLRRGATAGTLSGAGANG